MDLRTRLARFDRTRPGGRAAGSPALIPVDREPRPFLEETLRPLDALLARGAQWVGGSPCGFLRWEAAVEPSAWPGAPRRAVPEDAFARLARQPAPAAGPWAVLDTETTGLMGGAGTLAFLVAVLRWDDDGSRCTQYFLPEPEGERAMLQALAHDLGGVAALVSYNGRAFDVPHLRARMRLHRIDEDVLERPHLDLLHPVRRLGAGWMSDARLATAEAQLLGRPREPDDIPGSQAPRIYQAYLLDGVDTGLGPIADHNRRDVESLMRLAGVVAAGFSGGEAAAHLPPPARLAAARALLRAGDASGALQMLDALVGAPELKTDAELRARALWHQFQCHRRAGDPHRALRALEGLDAAAAWRLPALVEAAKLLEHRLRDFVAARDRVLRALQLSELDLGMALGGDAARPAAARWMRVAATDREALVHRLRRLERRAARVTAAGGAKWTP